MSKDNLEWLDEWYQRQCNGTWEHSQGVHLRSLDNPGWHLSISLAGTSAENASPQKISLDTPAGDWITCSISADRFDGSGDPRKLEQIIGVFRKWVDTPPAVSSVLRVQRPRRIL
jgi:hypothetical protein